MARDITIRPLTRPEVDVALEWAAQEGWNPGLHDGDCFFAIDEGGFLGALRDGEIVATISVLAYDEAFGFLGFYIVRPDCRRQGLGLKLWQAGLARLGNRTVGLDGVVAQQDNYRKSGFALAWRNIRYEGRGGGRVPAGVTPLESIAFAEIAAYDRGLFPAERRSFLNCWLSRPGVVGLGVVEAGALAGYAVMRPCRVGFKIGPLFADDPEIAERLLTGLAARAAGEAIFLDVPQPNSAAVGLAERHAMRPCFETARMYKGRPPEHDLDRLFGVTTFEAG